VSHEPISMCMCMILVLLDVACACAQAAVARCSRSCWLRCYGGWTTLQLWNWQLHETRAQFLILLKDW
jgi:hypothetical protein